MYVLINKVHSFKSIPHFIISFPHYINTKNINMKGDVIYVFIKESSLLKILRSFGAPTDRGVAF